MKSITKIFALALVAVTLASCEKYIGGSTLGGTVSPMGEPGTTYSSTSMEIAGVSDFEASVVSVKDKISTFSGSAIVTSQAIRNILANSPMISISGNKVTATDVQFKNTSEGMESVAGLDPGIIVKYNAKVGDTYTTESNRKRTVKSVSTTDDYPYGFMLIKVIKVEEDTNAMGVKKITYWANHKWGLVSIEFEFDDGTTAKFPVYCSTNN
jgi:hypothetical protein